MREFENEDRNITSLEKQLECRDTSAKEKQVML